MEESRIQQIEQSAVSQDQRPKGLIEGEASPWSGGSSAPPDGSPQPFTPATRRRAFIVGLILGVLLLTAVLPPLLNVNRYRRRIASSISLSLGRPVHLDSVSLNILPLPGFTLQNFVVGEDPAFGSEPVIRANSVRATLRIRSLWHRRVEFSRISLDEPSVNLVHRADGRWNIESILLQASRMPAAPTAQPAAGDTPRFPYIVATGARVNLKQDLEKLPISLTDASFALWLPQPESWHVRLEAHPTRTNVAATDTGTLRIDGTLGSAQRLEQVPVDLRGDWSNAPLGGVSWVVLGHDGGMRGDLTLHAGVHGTLRENTLTAQLEINGLRRADFVPVRTLDVDLNCTATATELFHALAGIRCGWPAEAGSNGLGGILIAGAMPDLRQPKTTKLNATWTNVPITGLLDAMRVASRGISPGIEAGGTFSGNLSCCEAVNAAGELTFFHVRLNMDERSLHSQDEAIPGKVSGSSVTLAPLLLDLGGPEPASLEAAVSSSGTKLRLAGTVQPSRLAALGRAVPQFGEGLQAILPAAPLQPVSQTVTRVEQLIAIDWTATKAWGQAQVWTAASAAPQTRRKNRRRHS